MHSTDQPLEGGRRQCSVQVGVHAFTSSVWNYCVDDKMRLARLAFDVYDRHTTGTITEADLEGMLIDAWGLKWYVRSTEPACNTGGEEQ